MKKIQSSSIISLLLLTGILIMLNVIMVRNFVRLDLTSSKMYTLSEASRKIVSEIPDKLIVKAYFSPNLPSPYNTNSQYLRDMLEDYRAFSKGHMQYEFIDPGTETALEQEAQSFRIPPQELQVVENDRIERRLVYMGVVFIYGDKREIIPVVQGISNLEYEITSLINRLTSPQLPKLGVTSTGSAENEVSTQALYEALARNFEVRQVVLDEPIPEDYAGVMLVAPREPLTDWQLFNLDQFIMRGGKVAIMANTYEASIQQNEPSTIRDLNLDTFLANYGIGINKDLLYDENASNIMVERPQGFFTIRQEVRLPYLPVITSFNRDHMITRQFDRLPLYFPSSIDTTLAAGKGFEIDPIMYTSNQSGRERSSTFYINAARRWTDADFNESSIPVAAVVQGEFTSMFAESGAPPKITRAADGSMEMSDEPFDDEVITQVSELNRLLVVGDGNIALDEFLNGYGMNFMLNTADWLAQAEDLISIRSKQITTVPLKEVSDFTRSAVKWLNQIGPIALIVLFGILLWQMRRMRKKALMVQ